MFERPFYAIRHATTAWNALGRFQGLTDVPLSPEGRAAARRNALRLAALFEAGNGLSPPARLLCSPLLRAAETARIVGDALGLPRAALSSDARLREAGFGVWEGLTTLEVKARFPAERRQRKADRWNFAPPGGESFEDLRCAMAAFVADLDASSLVVTHSGNLRVLLAMAGASTREEALRMPISQEALFVFGDGPVRML